MIEGSAELGKYFQFLEELTERKIASEILRPVNIACVYGCAEKKYVELNAVRIFRN